METNQAKILNELPIPKAVAKIGIPAMASMLIMAVYNLVDTIFIGMLGDDKALSAVAVAFPIMTLMSAVGQVFGGGSASTIGRAFGNQDNEYANKVASTIIYTSFIAGIVFMAIGLVFIEEIFTLFGTTESVMSRAKEYGGWMFVGAVFSIPNQTFNNITRAEAKATLSMKALSIGAISNMILDPIFMFELGGYGLNMGIEGASLATTLAQALGFIFISSHFFLGKMTVKLKPSHFAPSRALYSEVFRTGAPIGITQMLSTFAVSVTNIASISYASDIVTGENIQSAYGIVLKVTSIIQSMIMGYLLGYQPLAAYAYGAKNKARFYEALRYIRKLILMSAAVVCLLVIFTAPSIMRVFTQNEQIVEIGVTFLRYNNSLLVFIAMSMFLMITFQATGNGKFGAFIALARQGFLYIPFVFMFCTVLGSDGLFYAQPVADFITAIFGFILYNKYKKMLEVYFETVD